MKARPTRRALVARAVDEDTRRALAEFATSVGVPPDRSSSVTDAAVVRVFRDRVPSDHAMVETLLRLEVRRVAAGSVREPRRSGGSAVSEAPTTRTRLTRRVRAARARRVALTAGAVLTACALTVGASAALTRLDRAPASAPVQPAAPPPTVVDEPTAPATPRVLGDVTAAEGLPPAQPLVEGMLEAADAGWSLLQFDALSVRDATFFYLMDPDGTLYEVPTPFSETTWLRDVALVDWLPGTSLVLMSWSWQHEVAVVDLLTGERFLTVPFGIQGHEYAQSRATFVKDGTTDVAVSWEWSVAGGGAPGGRVVRLGLDGVERATVELTSPWRGAFTEPLLSDDGTRLVVDDAAGTRVLDAADFGEVATVPVPGSWDPSDCGPVRWLSADAVLVGCSAPSDSFEQQLWVAPLDGAAAVRLSDSYATAWAADDGLVLVEYAELSSSAPDSPRWGNVMRRCGWDGSCADERLAETAAWYVSGVVDGVLYAFDAPFEGGMLNARYVAVDLTTGEERILLDSGPGGSIRTVVPSGVRGPAWTGSN